MAKAKNLGMGSKGKLGGGMAPTPEPALGQFINNQTKQRVGAAEGPGDMAALPGHRNSKTKPASGRGFRRR